MPKYENAAELRNGIVTFGQVAFKVVIQRRPDGWILYFVTNKNSL